MGPIEFPLIGPDGKIDPAVLPGSYVPMPDGAAAGTVPTTQADGSVLYVAPPGADISAFQAQLDAMQSQVDQLTASSATIEDLAHAFVVAASWTSGTQYVRWVAPYACQIISAQVMRRAAIALNASNYWQLKLQRARANVFADIVTKTTAQEAVAAFTNWSLDGSTWNTTNAQLAKGDGLVLQPTNAGTVTDVTEFVVTCAVQPL